jgi:hypothetical protein
MDWILRNPSHARSLLSPAASLFAAKVIVWDTENDGRGQSGSLAQARQWAFKKLYGDYAVLDLRRGQSGYTYVGARRDILGFIEDADYLLGFENKSVDRNRLKALLNETDPIENRRIGRTYEEITPKLKDIRRNLIDCLWSVDWLREERAYLSDGMLSTCWKNWLKAGEVEIIPQADILCTVRHGGDKCTEVDIPSTANLYLTLKSFYMVRLLFSMVFVRIRRRTNPSFDI